jgi:hypothetical protein
MKNIQRTCSVAILALLCAACGSAEKPAVEEPMAPTETVVGDQVRALERARAVETQTMESKQAIDRALEENEGPGGQ